MKVLLFGEHLFVAFIRGDIMPVASFESAGDEFQSIWEDITHGLEPNALRLVHASVKNGLHQSAALHPQADQSHVHIINLAAVALGKNYRI